MLDGLNIQPDDDGHLLIFFDAVESAIERIRNAPTQFREIEPGVRVCRVPNFPYAIYYIIEISEIIIVAVKHDRRDPGYWRHRIP
jgi:plasmid stabilization system protein ParE